MCFAYHPQTNDQTEVTNQALGDLLCCLVGDNINSWDNVFCQAEFTHNHVLNSITGFSPFRVSTQSVGLKHFSRPYAFAW